MRDFINPLVCPKSYRINIKYINYKIKLELNYQIMIDEIMISAFE